LQKPTVSVRDLKKAIKFSPSKKHNNADVEEYSPLSASAKQSEIATEKSEKQPSASSTAEKVPAKKQIKSGELAPLKKRDAKLQSKGKPNDSGERFVADTQNPDYFKSPAMQAAFDSAKATVYPDLAALKLFVEKLNSHLDKDPLQVTALKDSKYVKIVSKFKKCPYQQWYNFKLTEKGVFTDLCFVRGINSWFSRSAHKAGEVKQQK
jgi:hypothetical protein